MTTFEFDEGVQQSTFKGEEFYTQHMNDLFLSEQKNLENILCQGKKIREKLKNVQPGSYLEIGGLMATQEEPLQIKKGGPGHTIGDGEYTLNRLTGMCAAYCARNRVTPLAKCAMAISLGIGDTDKKLYYSAAPGAEHFTEVFDYYPLLCAIQQLKSGKVSKESIARIASVKNKDGVTLAQRLVADKANVTSKVNCFGKGNN
ncbi:uncharacterized protein LOC133525321 [Cydia pomonella]|uniref:uncharacterized protein LOC133525321 n=1 Tax=Cydia pomonella TaxID=82600 RepID=UPI002ADD73AA|nr:uncharacterized protein LOC133525321 [Cydia pomonella]